MYFPFIELRPQASPAQQPLLRPKINPVSKTDNKSAARILLVDDEEELLAVNSMLLESAGYQVTAINNMQGAIALLNHQQFDLVLSDIVMPNGTGLQLAAYIQRNYPSLPVQLVSGFADESMIEDESSRHFFDNRLQKPLTTALLLKKVAELVLISNSKDNSHVSL
jgi:CheY-like chemotaxis protein